MTLRSGILLLVLILFSGTHFSVVRATPVISRLITTSVHYFAYYGMPDVAPPAPDPKPESEKAENEIEQVLESITNYRYILLYVLLAVTIFGGIGFVIAILAPETRMFFFSDSSIRNAYILLLFLFVFVLLRVAQIVSNSTLFFAFAFLTGVGACLLANKLVARQKRNLP
jgi:hypothetical protein